MKKLFLRFPIFFIAIGIFLVYLLLLGIFFNSGNQTQRSSGQAVSNPTVTPNPFVLTNDELQIPEATPQEFEASINKQTGTIIVTANVLGVSVKIDQPGIGESQGAQDQELIPQIPNQHTPFKYSDIPVGIHTLLASKQGYYAQKLPVAITENKITRVHIQLVQF